MSVRAVSVMDDGTISRVIVADPTMISLNIDPGDTLFQLTEDEGGFIDDGNIIVSMSGDFEPKPGYTGDFYRPSGTLELVVT